MNTEAPIVSRRALLGAAVAMPFLNGPAFAQEVVLMTIRVTFADQLLTIDLYDNASARELAAMLPLDLTISDFGSNEKIAYLPRKLTDLARGPFPNAAPGDLCYYVPWGNLAFFYGGYQSTRDLVRLGRLQGKVEPLLVAGEFPVRIEAL